MTTLGFRESSKRSSVHHLSLGRIEELQHVIGLVGLPLNDGLRGQASQGLWRQIYDLAAKDDAIPSGAAWNMDTYPSRRNPNVAQPIGGDQDVVVISPGLQPARWGHRGSVAIEEFQVEIARPFVKADAIFRLYRRHPRLAARFVTRHRFAPPPSMVAMIQSDSRRRHSCAAARLESSACETSNARAILFVVPHIGFAWPRSIAQ